MKRGQTHLLFDCFERSAIVSDDRRYRYVLTRIWSGEAPPLYWVMLNPSTADADEDDPTVKSCIRFARHNGFGGIVILNLFALRATDPRSLLQWEELSIGILNDQHMGNIPTGATVVCAWGTLPYGYSWSLARIGTVRIMLRSMKIRAMCVCKSGAAPNIRPWYPLYVKAGKLLPYSLEER